MPEHSPKLTHTLRDGSTVRASAEHMATVLDIEARQVSEERRWIARLRERGVKAAHPDDGWVKSRFGDAPSVHLEYPQFRDGEVEVGDLVALGRPWSATRIVRVRRIESPWPSDPGLRYHYFEEVEIWPDPRQAEPKRARWRFWR